MSNIGIVCSNIVEQDGRYLLVQETDGRYNLPGGRLEDTETLLECQKREGKEESGLELRAIGIVGMYQRPESSKGYNLTIIVYESEVEGGEITTSDEHPVIDFFDYEQIKEFSEDGLLARAYVLPAIDDFRNRESLDLSVIKILKNE